MSAIQTIIENLQDLSINVANNGIRFNGGFKNMFNLANALKLKKFQLKIGFNDVEVDCFQCALKEISMAPHLEKLSLDL